MLQRHQNEKNCQQSTFLARIIYSLSLSFFFFRIRSFFAPLFGAWFPSLCLGRRGLFFPQNKPIRQPFPLRTRKCPFDFPSRKLCLFLSLFRRASFALFSFLAEDIYILLYSSSSLVVWRSKSARGKIIVGETIRFFRDSFRARVSSVTLSWKRVDWKRVDWRR